MKSNSLYALGVSLAATFAASLYFSPYLTVHQMRQAIKAEDADSLSAHVDFPALQESFKAQYMMKIDSGETASNVFAAFGQVMAAKLVNQLVGAMVTPSGVLQMMSSTRPSPLPFDPEMVAGPAKKSQRDDPKEFSLSYLDWSRVKLHNAHRGPENGAFILRREGLWRWRLAAVELPE